MLQKFIHRKKYLNTDEQKELIKEIANVVTRAPLFIPKMPKTGNPFSVRMTNCGSLGWVSDQSRGYRYQSFHPDTKEAWPPIPERLLNLWDEITKYPLPPEACLINAYSAAAKMGLHQDRDEKDLDAPVLSVSLGDTATFRIGGTRRKDPTRSFSLESGDIVALAGEDRLAYHGIDRIKAETTGLLKESFPGFKRINLTLRRVTKPD